MWYSNELHTTDDFNYKLRKIEDRIEYLTFGNAYNQELRPGVLPRYLKELKFGDISIKK